MVATWQNQTCKLLFTWTLLPITILIISPVWVEAIGTIRSILRIRCIIWKRYMFLGFSRLVASNFPTA